MLGKWCVITKLKAEEGKEELSTCVFGPFDSYEEIPIWIEGRKKHSGDEVIYKITILFTKEGE